MLINSSLLIQTQQWVELTVTHNGDTFKIQILAVNGIVQGTYKDNVATAHLKYFNTVSDEIRNEHFQSFKQYIEANHQINKV